MNGKLTDTELTELLAGYSDEVGAERLKGVLGTLRQVSLTLETAVQDKRGPLVSRLRAIRDGLVGEAQGIVTAYRLDSRTVGTLSIEAGITPSGQILRS